MVLKQEPQISYLYSHLMFKMILLKLSNYHNFRDMDEPNPSKPKVVEE